MKTASLLTAFSLAVPSLAATAADWQSRSIYQVITDRFAKTTDDGGPCDSSARQYCGGTWKGIINHLDYIKNMGFDAIWISPVVENLDETTPYGQAYHGYWTSNINNLNPHFGTADDLKSLSAALHSKGMYLMVDVVVNHVAATSTPPALKYDAYGPFNVATDYHSPFCFITDYNDQAMVEKCSVGDSTVALVDLDTDSDNVKQIYNTWIKKLVTDYSIDGIRIDTVKHVQKNFFPGFASASGVYTLGEVLDTKWNYTGDYSNYMDAVFNYPEWFSLINAFGGPLGDISSLTNSVTYTAQNFKNGGLISTSSFSENHDNARLPSMIKDSVQVKNIITWSFIGDGIPTLYYGQEASYDGGNDPLNREALWFTSYSTEVALYKYITTLNAARKLALADKTFTTTPRKVVASDAKNIAIAKGPLLSVFTNAGQGTAASWTVTGSGIASGQQLVDVASDACDVVTVAADGSIPVTYTNGQPKVYLAATSLSSSGLCGSKAVKGSTSTNNNNGASSLMTAGTSALALTVAAAIGFISFA